MVTEDEAMRRAIALAARGLGTTSPNPVVGCILLDAEGERLARRAAAKLEHMGVEIRTGARVTGMDAASVELESADGVERLPTMTKVWSAGVQASRLGRALAGAWRRFATGLCLLWFRIKSRASTDALCGEVLAACVAGSHFATELMGENRSAVSHKKA